LSSRRADYGAGNGASPGSLGKQVRPLASNADPGAFALEAVMLLRLAPLLLAVAAQAWSQSPAIPDTPAGRQFAAWLALFNRGDRDAYKEFIDKNYPSDP